MYTKTNFARSCTNATWYKNCILKEVRINYLNLYRFKFKDIIGEQNVKRNSPERNDTIIQNI